MLLAEFLYNLFADPDIIRLPGPLALLQDSIAYFIAWIIALVLSLLLIGFLLMPFLIGWGLWVIIDGAIQISNGEAPHYPLVIKILK